MGAMVWNVAVIPILVGVLGTVSNSLEKWLDELEIWGIFLNHQYQSTIEICLGTEDTPGELRTFAVCKTLMENPQLELMSKYIAWRNILKVGKLLTTVVFRKKFWS